MYNLREFVLACLDDDERKATAATPGPWRWERTPGGKWGHQPPDLLSEKGDLVIMSYGYDQDGILVEDPDAEFIARHSPAEALRDIAMKRAILDHHGHTATTSHRATDADFGCGVCHVYDGLVAGYGWCHTVRLLATSFPGRVGFDPTWAVGL